MHVWPTKDKDIPWVDIYKMEINNLISIYIVQ